LCGWIVKIVIFRQTFIAGVISSEQMPLIVISSSFCSATLSRQAQVTPKTDTGWEAAGLRLRTPFAEALIDVELLLLGLASETQVTVFGSADAVPLRSPK